MEVVGKKISSDAADYSSDYEGKLSDNGHSDSDDFVDLIDRKQQRAKIHNLPRGGTIVETSLGQVQFGSPPNTIKDSLKLGSGVPTTFVLPRILFDSKRGINTAEIEFPTYWNFFVCKKKVTFICSPEQEKRVRAVLQETLLGPLDINIEDECARCMEPDLIPKLAEECAYMRDFDNIDQMVSFVHFAPLSRHSNSADDGMNYHGTKPNQEEPSALVANLGSGVKILRRNGTFDVFDNGQNVATIDENVQLPPSVMARRLSVSTQYDPPAFGITVLGNSHGFDPTHSTTGFVVWVQGRGVIVDPPLNSVRLLHEAGIPSRVIDAVIVSHCHADHDAGAFQWLLNERKLELITTPTIMNSWLRKYSALLDMDKESIRDLFLFRPALLGEGISYRGATFHFHYGIHTIPAIGFDCYYNGKSIFYSGDTINSVPQFEKMRNAGILRPGRFNQFANFTWHHSVILHEAGVPPIHTPVSTFKALPDDVKDRLYLVHIAESAVPEGLKLAKAGVHNSIEIDVDQHDFLDAFQLLETIESVDIFRSIVDARRSREALLCSKIEHFEPGQVICEQGSMGDKFYIIRKGVVSVFAKGALKHLISGDFFGEQSLVHENTRRTATCLACCKVTLISFNRLDFLSLIRGSASTVKDILNLASMRKDKSWSVLAGNSIFGNMTSHQKQSLQGLLKKSSFAKGDKIWQAGKSAQDGLLLLSGSLLVTRQKRSGNDCKEYVDQVVSEPSTFLCDSHTMLRPEKHNDTTTDTSVSVEALTDCVIYTVSRKDLQWFLSTNPGPKLAMHNTLCIPALPCAHGDDEDITQTFISL